MGKQVLKVLDDFYEKNIAVGEIVHFIEGAYKILDTHFQNQFGEFILCEYLEEIGEDMDSKVEQAIPAHANNPYEIIGTIHMKGYRNLLAGPGFFVKNIKTGDVKGYSFRETMQLLMREGATNANATRTVSGIFRGSTIDSIEGLPSFDSHYWKKEVYDQAGKPFAELTISAKREVEKALKYAIEGLISDYQSSFSFKRVDEGSITKLREEIDAAKNIVVLTGAGISTMSGIPDYRSSVESMWVKNPVMLSGLNENAFRKNPHKSWATFFQFLQECIANILPFPTHEAFLAARNVLKPNNVHRYFADLQADKNVIVITQNVDGFHEKAGSETVIEFHGNVNECVCQTCFRIELLDKFIEKLETPTCECGSVMRPNVVFFGDAVKGKEQAENSIRGADLIIVAGTGLKVYPFNQLPEYKRDDAKLVLLNSENDTDYLFDLVVGGNISEVVYRLSGKRKG
jgi:NAD-dependent SIR2 family protein deacetylase/molecular chaperone GrpE (heat shock protein)